jgi:hypothetical protein
MEFLVSYRNHSENIKCWTSPLAPFRLQRGIRFANATPLFLRYAPQSRFRPIVGLARLRLSAYSAASASLTPHRSFSATLPNRAVAQAEADGGTGEIRTHGLKIRNPALYPAELQPLSYFCFLK